MSSGAHEDDLGRAAARGGVWSVAAEISSRASQSIVFFVLAGFLSPKQFGAAAVAFVCVQVVNSLTYAGLGSAVQVLGPDTDRDRTAVGAALFGGALGGALLALMAGPLCDLLGVPEATGLVRLVGLALPLAQTSEVLSALLARDLRFRTTGSAVVVASVVSAVVGLGLAAAGAGAGALVAQAVVQPAARLLLLVAARRSAFRPALHRARLRELWGVGRDLLLSNTFDTAAANVDNVVVSALAGAAALGAYGFGFNLTALPTYVIGYAAGRVALPLYALLLSRGQPLAQAFCSAIETTAWLTALPLGFLAVAGPEALRVVFGTTWDPVSGALRVLALAGWLRAVETASTTLLVATGDTRTARRVQQWQLAFAVILLPGLVELNGIIGAATAVAIAVFLGTSFSLRSSSRRSHASLPVLLLRMAESGVGGLLGGAAALGVLTGLTGGIGLPLAFLAAIVAWVVTLAVVRPSTLASARHLLGRGVVPPDPV